MFRTDEKQDCGFENFTPELFLDAVEEALETRLTGYAAALPSYINRVYELEAVSGERVIAKFYRPGRWTPEAILDEHDFLWDCADRDIPVVPPYELSHSSTLGFAGNIPFAVFPKKRGREAEFESEESFRRVGTLLGQIHACGSLRRARHRMDLTPDCFACPAMERIFRDGLVHPSCESALMNVCDRILDVADELFRDPGDPPIRIHGDFHRANVLNRLDEGLLAIDFDDMLNGPPVQDFWLLLPGSCRDSGPELDALLNGYRLFMDFNESSLKLIEPLRAMRMMHYLSWCAAQSADRRFRELYPDWGSESFWRSELADFRVQLRRIEESLEQFPF